ncbi:MAG: aminoacyl-tRNA hydrolase [Pseudanabaena sp. CRU_2_10]|nr:aminoacyl-tRNA hydrolase [Pseudanabaena sp. CRU_2_10]
MEDDHVVGDAHHHAHVVLDQQQRSAAGAQLHQQRVQFLALARIEAGGRFIKAQQHRTQEQNKEDALKRLQMLIQSVTVLPPKRRPTKPSRSAQSRRIDSKTKRGEIKALRGNVNDLE